jgi:pimeloyl-[acyl-carrier protein] methyl ester esterase
VADGLRPRPVVLLHGWTMRGVIFDDLIARLPPELDCHAPDLPGHGTLSAAEPSLAAASQTLSALLEERDLNDVVLVGWSMGAAVAWQYLETFGADRIAGLMSVDMSPKLACGPDWPHGLIGQSAEDLETTTKRMIADWPGMAEAIATTMFADRHGAPGYSRSTALAQILSNDPARMITMWKALAGHGQARGDQDPAMPAACHLWRIESGLPVIDGQMAGRDRTTRRDARIYGFRPLAAPGRARGLRRKAHGVRRQPLGGQPVNMACKSPGNHLKQQHKAGRKPIRRRYPLP